MNERDAKSTMLKQQVRERNCVCGEWDSRSLCRFNKMLIAWKIQVFLFGAFEFHNPIFSICTVLNQEIRRADVTHTICVCVSERV